MTESVPWDWKEMRALLRMRAFHMQLNKRLLRRFDWSDLAQEALMKAHQRFPQFKGTTRGELVNWLLTILKNTYKDLLEGGQADKRDVNREQPLDALWDESHSRWQEFVRQQQPSPSEQVEQEELLLRVSVALDELPEDEREAVVMRYLVGDTLAAIAEKLGRPETTVTRLIRRGTDKVHARLAASA